MPATLLTDYYSDENAWDYMSASQFRDFVTCEAAALAKLRGEWPHPPTTAMLVGSYLHAAIEGDEAFAEFCMAHEADIHTTRGNKGKRAEFVQADAMIETLQSDLYLMSLLSGQHEVVLMTELYGVAWKAKLDVLNEDSIVDVKTTRSLYERYWDKAESRYVSFVEQFGYTRQLALYSELERLTSGRETRLATYVVAVTKEDPPDKALIEIDADRVYWELEVVKGILPRIQSVKLGEIEPRRCERCEYCRATKQLTGPINFMELV